MQLRNYDVSDLSAIEALNQYCAVSIRFHRDIKPENVLCVVSESDELAGVGYLKSNESQAESECLFELSTFVGDAYDRDLAVEAALLDGLTHCVEEIRSSTPSKTVRLRSFCEADDIDRIQLFMEKGFHLHAVIPVLKYDLRRETRHYRIPDDVQIRELSFTNDEVTKYVNADRMTGENPQGPAEIRFKSGDPTFKCFVATCGAEVVGAISVWDITDERAATENIFVIEPYRRKNIARELMATAFDELKRRGKKTATLSVRGTNVPALKLYLSSGYSLYYNLVELMY